MSRSYTYRIVFAKCNNDDEPIGLENLELEDALNDDTIGNIEIIAVTPILYKGTTIEVAYTLRIPKLEEKVNEEVTSTEVP